MSVIPPELTFEAVDFDPFAPNSTTVTSTEAQREIFTSVLLGGDAANCAYNESVTLKISGPLNKELLKDPMCMNLKEGGTGGWVSKEVQLKCSIAGGYAISEKLKNDDIFRTNFSNVISNALKEQYKDKTRSGFSGTRFNQLHSEETKELMSEQRKGTGVGETNSQYGTCWITKDGVNKKIKKEEFEIYQLEGWVKGRK